MDVVPSLISHVFNPSFKAYEFLDSLDAAKNESAAALADPQTEIFEKLHQIAFRTGLGNSVCTPASSFSGIARADIAEFAQSHFTPDRITIVGSGVNHQELKDLVETAFEGVTLSTILSHVPESHFYAGEARIDAGPHSDAQYVIAYPGTPYTSSNYPASQVLAAMLGAKEPANYVHHQGLLASATHNETIAKSFSVSYSDAGLLGIEVKGDATDVRVVASSAIEILHSIAKGVTSQALADGIKAAIIQSEEALTRRGLLDALGKDSKTFGTQELSAISKVTAEQVQKVFL